MQPTWLAGLLSRQFLAQICNYPLKVMISALRSNISRFLDPDELHPRERQEYGKHRQEWGNRTRVISLSIWRERIRGWLVTVFRIIPYYIISFYRWTEMQRYPDRERSPSKSRSQGHQKSPAEHPRSPGLTLQYQRHYSEVSDTESCGAERQEAAGRGGGGSDSFVHILLCRLTRTLPACKTGWRMSRRGTPGRCPSSTPGRRSMTASSGSMAVPAGLTLETQGYSKKFVAQK